MKEFDINNKIFDIPIETPPSNQYNPKYIIDKDKVQLMLKYNNGAIVWRYIEGFDNNYILGCNGEMWRYDKRKNDWVKVRFTQVKDSFQTKLLDSNKKRHTKKLNLLMKETFPELITYSKIKIEEEKIAGQNDIVRQKLQNEAKIKCFNNVTKKTTYYMTVSQAEKGTNISSVLIEKNLSREINNIGGLIFYYN